MTSSELLDLAKRYFKAYNDLDLAVMGALLADDVHWEHHNRFKGVGKAELLASIETIASTTPGRHFGEIKRSGALDGAIFVENEWRCTPTQSDPQFGWKAGEPFSMDVVSLLAVRDGKIVEWSDWG